jgi:hypothetical protein
VPREIRGTLRSDPPSWGLAGRYNNGRRPGLFHRWQPLPFSRARPFHQPLDLPASVTGAQSQGVAPKTLSRARRISHCTALPAHGRHLVRPGSRVRGVSRRSPAHLTAEREYRSPFGGLAREELPFCRKLQAPGGLRLVERRQATRGNLRLASAPGPWQNASATVGVVLAVMRPFSRARCQQQGRFTTSNGPVSLQIGLGFVRTGTNSQEGFPPYPWRIGRPGLSGGRRRGGS